MDITIWIGILRALILYIMKFFFAIDAKFIFQIKKSVSGKNYLLSRREKKDENTVIRDVNLITVNNHSKIAVHFAENNCFQTFIFSSNYLKR